mgnify:CR=1 FL=1
MKFKLMMAAALFSTPVLAQENAAQYKDKPYKTILQAEFETFMGCYGNMAGALDMLARVAPGRSNEAALNNQLAGGRAMVMQHYEPVLQRLKDARYGLDRSGGKAAFNTARKPFDDLSSADHSVQLKYFGAHSSITPECGDSIETLVVSTNLNASIWENAGAPTVVGAQD